MDGCSMVLVIGPTEQDPGELPLQPRLLKFDGCSGNDFVRLSPACTDPDLVAAFLLKAPAAAVCATLAATDGDIHSFPETDTIVEIFSLSKKLLEARSALVAACVDINARAGTSTTNEDHGRDAKASEI